MSERIILHCDMNNFYASVECMLNPALRDKAVVVGGSVEQRHGIVLAKNYKAKAFGIQTGEALWQARNKCKDIVVVPPNYDQYLRFSELAREIYSRFTDQVEPYGMDECWLDVSGSRAFGRGESIADEIREIIKFELGLTVSIGVSYNKIFAKLGSDLKKPDAVTTIYKADFRAKVWPLAAGELLGVGRATEKKLRLSGIYTIGELANANKDLLRKLLGINGLKLKLFANGLDSSKVLTANVVSPIKSIGHGITTVADLENSAEVWRVILALVQDVGTKLRRHHKRAGGVALYIRNNKLVTNQWQGRVALPTQSATVLAQKAFELFVKHYKWHHHIRSLSVQAINLIEESLPLPFDLFTDHKALEKREKLDLAIENIRFRFGKEAIKNSVLLQDIKLPSNLDAGVRMPTGMVQ